jgi:hypothetical protein
MEAIRQDFEVKFQGGVYVARKRGGSGRVFGRSPREALQQADFWERNGGFAHRGRKPKDGDRADAA